MTDEITSILVRLENIVSDLRHTSEDLKSYKTEHREDIKDLWKEVSNIKEKIHHINAKIFAATILGVSVGALFEYVCLWRMGK